MTAAVRQHAAAVRSFAMLPMRQHVDVSTAEAVLTHLSRHDALCAMLLWNVIDAAFRQFDHHVIARLLLAAIAPGSGPHRADGYADHLFRMPAAARMTSSATAEILHAAMQQDACMVVSRMTHGNYATEQLPAKQLDSEAVLQLLLAAVQHNSNAWYFTSSLCILPGA